MLHHGQLFHAASPPLSAHPVLPKAGAELGTHCPFPLLSWQGSQALQPGACGDLGPAGCPGKKEREEARTPPTAAPPTTSPPLRVLNAEGEQRVLSERARGWDRVGAAGNQPRSPHCSLVVAAGAGWAPSHQCRPFPQLPRCPSRPQGAG